MSIVTYEYLVAQVLEDTLAWVKKNPYFVDLAIASHRTDLLSQLQRILTEGMVNVILEYSWKKPSFPAYVVFLTQESESAQYVGDVKGEAVPLLPTEPGDPPEWETLTQVPLSFTTFPHFQLPHFPLLSCTLYCGGIEIPPTDFSLNPRNGKGTLLGEYDPTATYTVTYTYFSHYVEHRGSHMTCTIRIDTIANNFDECLFLYRFLVYLLLGMRTFLSTYGGMKNQRLSSEVIDVYQEGEQPEPLYVRRLYLTFDVEGFGVIPLNILRTIEIR